MTHSNKRIAKNSIFLTIRLLLSTIIILYSTRLTLRALGFVDYGIYSVVAGVILFFSFLNNALSSSTQRNLSYEMGKESGTVKYQIFHASVRIHLILGVLIVILCEILGFVIFNYLQIPENRMSAAHYIYQCVIIIFFFTIIGIPYLAITNSHEDMHVIAFIGFFDSIAKLGIAIILLFNSNFDKLILYGNLLVVLSVVTFILYYTYTRYCYRDYYENKKININKKLYKELISFAKWSLLGSLGYIFTRQGSTVILNIFFGPIVNSAFGIAQQVSNQLSSFSTIALKAVNPVIDKSYGMNEVATSVRITNISTKYSFFFFSTLSLPFLFITEPILKLWLGEIPNHAVILTKILTINLLFEIYIGPLVNLIYANGRIKKYELRSLILSILYLPLLYMLLKGGSSAGMGMCLLIVYTIILGGIRLYYLKKIMNFSITDWFNNVFINGLKPFVGGLVVAWGGSYIIKNPFILIGISVLSCCILIYTIGLSKQEKSFVISLIRKNN